MAMKHLNIRFGSSTTYSMKVAANHLHLNCNVHMFDMSNISHGFSYHYPPAPTVYGDVQKGGSPFDTLRKTSMYTKIMQFLGHLAFFTTSEIEKSYHTYSAYSWNSCFNWKKSM